MSKPKGFRPKDHHLTAHERQAMPKSDFALPGHGKGPKGAGAGSYPIDTEARARSALSRGAPNASPSELAQIKRRVHEKYPDIKIAGQKRRERMYDHPSSKKRREK